MKVFGYVTSRSFQGLTIPVPAQNACLREYARTKELMYVLPPLEHYFDNCYMQLFTALNSLQFGDTLAMYSAAMLPISSSKLHQIFKIIENKNASIYFVLEAKLVYTLNECQPIIFSYSLRNTLDKMSQLPIESLRNLTNNSAIKKIT